MKFIIIKKKHNELPSLLLFNVSWLHRHLSYIDCLMVHATCLVCFISTFNGRSKKKGKKCGASSRHITNLKQSIFSFDIYGWLLLTTKVQSAIALTLTSSLSIRRNRRTSAKRRERRWRQRRTSTLTTSSTTKNCDRCRSTLQNFFLLRHNKLERLSKKVENLKKRVGINTFSS